MLLKSQLMLLPGLKSLVCLTNFLLIWDLKPTSNETPHQVLKRLLRKTVQASRPPNVALSACGAGPLFSNLLGKILASHHTMGGTIEKGPLPGARRWHHSSGAGTSGCSGLCSPRVPPATALFATPVAMTICRSSCKAAASVTGAGNEHPAAPGVRARMRSSSPQVMFSSIPRS